MTEPTKPIENKNKLIAKELTETSAQAMHGKQGVSQRIAHMEAIQHFQLIAKKRSRPFWKKMLSIK